MRYLIQWHSVEPDLWRTYQNVITAELAGALLARLQTAHPPASDWRIVAEGQEEPSRPLSPPPLTRLSVYEAEPGPDGRQPIDLSTPEEVPIV